MRNSVAEREIHTTAYSYGRLRFQRTKGLHRLSDLMIKKVLTRLLVLILIVSTTGLSYGQQDSRLSSRASALKKKADRLSPGAQIRVIKMQGSDQYGQFRSDDDTGFTIYDIDRNENVSLRFEEVRKIKVGYGARNSSRQTRKSHRGAIIATCATLGVIGVLIAAVASAKD